MDWFKSNEMIVNPDKYQAITVYRNNKMSDAYFLNIGKAKVKFEKLVPLLGIKIGNNLSFENHISFIC